MTTPSVRIRMYRQRFGDCFLLRFPRAGGASAADFNLLIDCGLISGGNPATMDCWPQGFKPVGLSAIVDDIYQSTNGHLDLVVGTHEHWDHLSGFNQAKAKFDQFKIDKIWLGWTEDPNNPAAQQLVNERSASLAALQAAVAKMDGAGFAEQKSRILQVLSFFGDDIGQGLGATAAGAAGNSASGGATTHAALQYLKSRPDAAVHYCDPNVDPPLSLDGVEAVRVYVFGPPSPKNKDDTQYLRYLKMTDPSQIAKTYDSTPAAAETSFFAAVSAASPAGPAYSPAQELSFPFEVNFRISKDEARERPDDFFRSHYGFDDADPQAWRRIDNDWLSLASELALNLDSDTNNTSLVLAFELGDPGSGRVLLFAADAQVGNWLSWGDLAWTVGNPGQKVSAHDLLARAVFYKVGHHGSHNATLSDLGLELMTSDDLVAMMSVDECIAHEVKKWQQMPYEALRQRLLKKTRGRLVRIDQGVPQEKSPDMTQAEWQSFLDAVTETDVYIEYTLKAD
jgi:hypothetical protein